MASATSAQESGASLLAAYEARPFYPSVERATVVSKVMRSASQFETIFTDYQRACTPMCEDARTCEKCSARLSHVSRMLLDPKAYVWEVWDDTPEVVGIVYLTDIVVGGDAKAHYLFWDRDLKGKTELLKQMIEWCFSEHDGWIPLRRLTVEVPDYAYALAGHAARRLGFGGPYQYKMPKGGVIPVEGVKKRAIPWNGRWADLIVMGLENNGTVH